jgi:hypothetical protein
MRGMVEHFKKTKKFELIVEEPWYQVMMDYKENWNSDRAKEYTEEIKEQLDYLENYRNELIECGLG